MHRLCVDWYFYCTFDRRCFASSKLQWRASINAEMMASEKIRAAVSKSVPNGAKDDVTERYCPVICRTSYWLVRLLSKF